MQPKTIKNKDNGCGTAPGNLAHVLSQNVLTDSHQVFARGWVGVINIKTERNCR